jgi:hypothetical protein
VVEGAGHVVVREKVEVVVELADNFGTDWRKSEALRKGCHKFTKIINHFRRE